MLHGVYEDNIVRLLVFDRVNHNVNSLLHLQPLFGVVSAGLLPVMPVEDGAFNAVRCGRTIMDGAGMRTGPSEAAPIDFAAQLSWKHRRSLHMSTPRWHVGTRGTERIDNCGWVCASLAAVSLALTCSDS